MGSFLGMPETPPHLPVRGGDRVREEGRSEGGRCLLAEELKDGV